MSSLAQENLSILIPGMTHVLDRGGKEAFVYFETGGTAHMLLETGETRSGTWQIQDDGYVAEWNTGAVGRWTIEHAPGELTYVNRDSAVRMKMRGVLFGNPQGLPRKAG